MIAAKTKYFKIKNPETGEFDSFIFIKGDKGYIIGPDQITNVLGNSEELVPTQALLTQIDTYFSEITEQNKQDIINLSTEVWGSSDPNTVTLLSRVQELESRIGSLEQNVIDLEAKLT